MADELAAHAATAHHVAPATWFISHTWSNAVADTLESIFHFFEEREDASNAVLWMDVFVDSQHAVAGAEQAAAVVHDDVQKQHCAHRQATAGGGCVEQSHSSAARVN